MYFILINYVEKFLRKYGIPFSLFDFPLLFDQIQGFLGFICNRSFISLNSTMAVGMIIGMMTHILELNGLSLQQNIIQLMSIQLHYALQGDERVKDKDIKGFLRGSAQGDRKEESHSMYN